MNSKTSNQIKPEDIGVNNLVNGKVENYHKDKFPTPPVQYFKHCRHFWIAQYDGDKRIMSPRILEWNPVNRLWYVSGTIATTSEPVRHLNGYIIISVVEVPDIPFTAKI
jgi:hypothetical protein